MIPLTTLDSSLPRAVPRLRVMVVEDSAVIRDFLTHILNLVPDLHVVGVAHDGEQAVRMVNECNPDIITMDIHMPGMDGFETTRQIMETRATPIVIVSGSSSVMESVTAFRAIAVGALAVVARPYGIGHPEFQSTCNQLIETLRSMAEVKVVRRWPKQGRVGAASLLATAPPPRKEVRIVAIGASTGGPGAIAAVLTALPKNLPFPLLIVQHMCVGFMRGFCEWLALTSGLPVELAVGGEVPLPGRVYVAPDGFHMGVSSAGRIRLDDAPPENKVRPSVAYLFRSVAETFGRHSVAILLTGMGADGARELKQVRDRGGLTIAQDLTSSIVHGMPGEAIREGAAMHVMPPDAIGAFIGRLAGIN